MNDRTGHPLAAHGRLLAEVLRDLDALAEPFDRAVAALAGALRDGGTILAAGNGGSAAEAQHLAGELVGRLSAARDRGPLAAVALGTDVTALTALANDFGYEQVYARQVEALGRRGDALVVLSTSGASPNLVAAVTAARDLGIATVGLLGGTARALHGVCDVVLAVPSDDVPVIQEVHLVVLHALVEGVEDQLSASTSFPLP